ncbi:MAG: hypothetical protein Q9188_002394 [Gyalolechia gomerana]
MAPIRQQRCIPFPSPDSTLTSANWSAPLPLHHRRSPIAKRHQGGIGNRFIRDITFQARPLRPQSLLRSRLEAKLERAIAPLREKILGLERQNNELKQHWAVGLEFGTEEEQEDGVHELIGMRGEEWARSHEGQSYAIKEESWRRLAVAESLGVVKREVKAEMERKYAGKMQEMREQLQRGIVRLESAGEALEEAERRCGVEKRCFDIVLWDYEGSKEKVKELEGKSREMGGDIGELVKRAAELEAKIAMMEKEMNDVKAQQGQESAAASEKPKGMRLRNRTVRGG